MFHVGNFTPNFHRGLNPGPLAPLASILPLRHKVKESPRPKIWEFIDLTVQKELGQKIFALFSGKLSRYNVRQGPFFNYVRVLMILILITVRDHPWKASPQISIFRDTLPPLGSPRLLWLSALGGDISPYSSTPTPYITLICKVWVKKGTYS